MWDSLFSVFPNTYCRKTSVGFYFFWLRDSEAQSCTVNIRELYEARNGPIEDDPTAETFVTDEPMVLVDENGNVIDDNFDASGKKPKREPNSVKILYNCL